MNKPIEEMTPIELRLRLLKLADMPAIIADPAKVDAEITKIRDILKNKEENQP